MKKENKRFVMNSTAVKLVLGDITKLTCGAIVNAANSTLLGGGGVDGAIHKAAGPRLLEECRTLGGCCTGEAKITKAYEIITADYIIHTVGPIYSGSPSDAGKLAMCYSNSLDLALEYKCRSIAFPCISTGVYGYPAEPAAEISLRAVADWLQIHGENSMEIIFCCFNERQFEIYEHLLK